LGFVTRPSFPSFYGRRYVNDLIDSITQFFREILADSVIMMLEGLFGQIDDQIADAEVEMGVDIVAGIGGLAFPVVQAIAENVIMPMAGAVLGFVIAYDLIHMVITSNNSMDIDMIGIVLKWIVKAFIAITIVTSTFAIVGAIFELGNEAIAGANPLIAMAGGSADISDALIDLRDELTDEDTSIGLLFSVLLTVLFLRPVFWFVGILVYIIALGRLFEIYISITIAPLPLATLINQHWQSMGFNYIKTLLAYSFQGLLMLLCLALYRVLLENWVNNLGAMDAITLGGRLVELIGYSVLLIMGLMKTPTVAKSIFGAS
jgi:hypothetical protein